jgi:hypothetical protein
MMMDAQNLDALTDEQCDLVALFFTLPTGWTNTYMVEIRLDDPTFHLLNGGDGLVRHGGNGSRCYAKHFGDPNWCIVHLDDVPEWDIEQMATRAVNAIECTDSRQVAG